MNLIKIVKEETLPRIEIDESSKTVHIRGGIFFNNITRAYYMIKGYSIERRKSD
jgi:hypothetical protein